MFRKWFEKMVTSLTLAKIHLINPVILDDIDIKEINNEQLTNASVADILEVAKAKVFQNNNMIYFLITFPNPELVCKKIKIFPVQHKNTILNLEDSNIFADCGSKTIAINQCEATVSTTFCKTTSTPTCAEQLTVAQCGTRSSHLNPITEVDEGIIIINDAAMRVTDQEGLNRTITRSYLITYVDRVSLNGTLFINQPSL